MAAESALMETPDGVRQSYHRKPDRAGRGAGVGDWIVKERSTLAKLFPAPPPRWPEGTGAWCIRDIVSG